MQWAARLNTICYLDHNTRRDKALSVSGGRFCLWSRDTKKPVRRNRTGLSRSTLSAGTARLYSGAALLFTEEIEGARDQTNQKQAAHAGRFGAFCQTVCHGEVSLHTHVQPVQKQVGKSLTYPPARVMPLVRFRTRRRAGMSGGAGGDAAPGI